MHYNLINKRFEHSAIYQQTVVTTQQFNMHNFLSNYDKIYQVLKPISAEDFLSHQRRKPKELKKQSYAFRRSRKRIETLFSQLCDRFMIRRNYTKSFEGFENPLKLE